MERDEVRGTGRFWNGVVITLFTGVVAGVILLVIEYKSGYFNLTPLAPFKRSPDPDKQTFNKKAAPDTVPKELPKQGPKLDVRAEPLKQTEPKDPKSRSKPEPPFVNLTLDHFADTYASLGERDRSTYLQSLAGKKITWTGYITQMYLSDKYLYLSDKKDGTGAMNVCVSFKDDMRLSVGPVMTKIYVSGPVEIRGHWVVINASELMVAR